jgi:predicted aconitase with swiveling domain
MCSAVSPHLAAAHHQLHGKLRVSGVLLVCMLVTGSCCWWYVLLLLLASAAAWAATWS